MKNIHIRYKICVIVSLWGAIFAITAFFPGYMSSDSILQYEQAQATAFTHFPQISAFTDLHPPAMGLVWKIVDRIYPGPAGMLVIHNLLYWTASGLLSFHLFRRNLIQYSIFSILIIGLFPPIFAIFSTIWKDVAMASTLFMGFALLISAHNQWSWLKILLAIISLFYAINVRHNGVIAVLPLTLLIGWIIATHNHSTQRTKIVISICVTLLTGLSYFAAQQITKFVVNGKTQFPGQQAQIHDLVGISLAENINLLPPFLNQPVWNLQDLEKIYTPKTTNIMFCCADTKRYLGLATLPSEYEDLKNNWQTAIIKYPVSYAKHRWGAFKAQLGISENEVCYPFQTEIEPNIYNITFTKWWLNDWVMNGLQFIRNSFFFRGWIYTLALTLILAWQTFKLWGMWSKRKSQNWCDLDIYITAFALSGLLNSLAYYFISLTCDFRYNLWSVITALVCTIMIISQSRIISLTSRARQTP